MSEKGICLNCKTTAGAGQKNHLIVNSTLEMTFPLFQSILQHFGDFVAILFAHLPICQMLKANWLKAVSVSLLVSNIDLQTGSLWQSSLMLRTWHLYYAYFEEVGRKGWGNWTNYSLVPWSGKLLTSRTSWSISSSSAAARLHALRLFSLVNSTETGEIFRNFSVQISSPSGLKYLGRCTCEINTKWALPKCYILLCR